MFDSNAALVIVPDLGRAVLGGVLEDGVGFLALGVVLCWVVAVLPLAGAVGAVGRAAGFIVDRETDVVRESWAAPARTGGVERAVESARVVALEMGARTVD